MTDALDLQVKETLFRFLEGDICLSDFENWIYGSEQLKVLIGKDLYLELVSVDFRREAARYESERTIFSVIERNEFIEWRLCRLMNRIIARPADVHGDILLAYRLYCRGYRFLAKIGMTYGINVACPLPMNNEWEGLSESQKDSIISGFYPAIIPDAQRILRALKNRQIIFSNSDDTSLLHGFPDKPDYLDNRTLSEQKKTAYRSFDMNKPLTKFVFNVFGIRILSYGPLDRL